MRYSDILSFEPITEVIQFDNLKSEDYQKNLVKTFVYPNYFITTVIPQIVNQFKKGGHDQKGVQVVGNYGTGKSHLMSLIMLLAEHAEYLPLIPNEQARSIFEPIAGKFKVHYFEMGTDRKLWDIVTYQLQQFLDENGVDYHFDKDSMKMYREQLEDMLSAFEDKYPDKGMLIVIDEMLSYLSARTADGQLDHDLQVLQALGQLCSDSRFGFMFGVQELIYQTKNFQFAANMLLKVKDRFIDLTIRKEDVSFVVQNRLLRKSDTQKAAIRKHLEKFVHLFGDMHGHLQEYIDLFPVHPSYFDNFQKIRLGRSQREVLKTLTAEFERIKNDDIPDDNPGLITYDRYWEQMMKSAALKAIPEFNKVAETIETIYSKIDGNFEGIRAKQKPLAKRIANATAIKILQDTLDKRNGSRAETLTDDICFTSPLAEDHDMLVDIVDNCAKLIVKATSGQYFEQDELSGEYRLRTEGGINIDQLIADYADNLSDSQKDESFFRFLTEALGMADSDPYRTGFRIYQHEIEWRSHKITRNGYIFMGNPDDRSTTHPVQYFYMIFMPIFQDSKKKRNNKEDEIYFVMDDLSDEFKELVAKFGSAYMQWNSADSNQKVLFRTAYENLLRKTRQVFYNTYLDCTKVYYSTEDPKLLKSFNIPGNGAALIDAFNCVASYTFENQFSSITPHYPAFTQASQVITNNNRDRYINSAKAKIFRPAESNRDGEAVLAALECFSMGQIDTQNSIYAQDVLDRLEEKGEGKVLNRDEIIDVLPNSNNRIWRSISFQVEADFEFVVLAALVSTGEIEITLNNGNVINASNLEQIRSLGEEDYFSFASVKRPKGINLPVVKAVTKAFCGKDLSGLLDKESTYAEIVNAGRKLAAETATFMGRQLNQETINVAGIDVVPSAKMVQMRHRLSAFKGFCDKLTTFSSQAKLKNMQWDISVVNNMIEAYNEYLETNALIKVAFDLQSKVSYLQQALQYVPANTPLFNTLQTTVAQFLDIIEDCRNNGGNSANVQNYIAALDEAKSKYIEWYLKAYHNYCLTDIDNRAKAQLCNSDEYRSCQILSGLAILNGSLFTSIRSDINRLKTADPNVENILKTTPYANFDPRNVRTDDMKSIHDLRQEVQDLLANWELEIKQFIQADEQKQSLELMDSGSRDFANRIVAGMENFTDEHSARSIVEFIGNLCQGFQRVEITINKLADVFNRPMTVSEAQTAFDRYLMNLTRGKDTSKVRIVLNRNND